MKNILLLLIITITAWGENLSLVSMSGQASVGSVSSLKKVEEKVEKAYSLDIDEKQLLCTFQDDSKNCEIHFLSTRGQLISKHGVERGKATIDLSSFSNALYLVKGYQEGKVLFAKAIQVQ